MQSKLNQNEMKISYCEQLSKEWFDLCVGSIGGTRFGQVISDRENRLVYDLLDEVLNGYVEPDDYVSDDMLFGTENEPIARQLYSEQTGIVFHEVGMIHSDRSAIHHASPDGLSDDGQVLEIKCTQTGAIHIQRFDRGPESSYLPQVINYFAVSDEVQRVHWVSYCSDRPERPIVAYIFTRETEVKVGRKMITIAEAVEIGRAAIDEIEIEMNATKIKFLFDATNDNH
jgi:hypothetical protein